MHYTDDILEGKIKELIQAQDPLKEWNGYVEGYKKFHRCEDVETMTGGESEILDKYHGEVLKLKIEY